MSMITGHYNINVTKVDPKTGRFAHFFDTDVDSGPNDHHVKEMYEIFKAKFPREEGYEITVMKVECSGRTILDNHKDSMKGLYVTVHSIYGWGGIFHNGEVYRCVDDDCVDFVTLEVGMSGQSTVQLDRDKVRVSLPEECP